MSRILFTHSLQRGKLLFALKTTIPILRRSVRMRSTLRCVGETMVERREIACDHCIHYWRTRNTQLPFAHWAKDHIAEGQRRRWLAQSDESWRHQ